MNSALPRPSRTNPVALGSLALGSLTVVALLAGCASEKSKPAAQAVGPVSSAPSSASIGKVTDGASLAALLRRGQDSVASAHVSMTVTIAGQKMTVAGAQKLAGGRAQSMDVSVPVSGIGTIRMMYVDDILYTKLPPSLSSTPTSWVIASPTSSNPALQQIAGSLPAMKNSASLESFTQYAAAATTFKMVGTKRIGGKKTTHYSLIVDVSKVQGPAGVELTEAGQKTLPVEIWSDDTGRVVQAKQARVVKGEAEPSEVTLSAYNVPVTIAAPPASQLVTG